MCARQAKRERRQTDKAAAADAQPEPEAKKTRKSAVRVVKKLVIGDCLIDDDCAFAAEHKRALEVGRADAGKPNEREARIQEGKEVAAWEARRGISVDDLKRSRLPESMRGPPPSDGSTAKEFDLWQVVAEFRVRKFCPFTKDGPSFYDPRRAAIEAVEIVGFVHFCRAVEEAFSIDDVMSEETAEQLAAADNLSLERNNTTKGHTTGFLDVSLCKKPGRFLLRVARVTVGTYTGRFEAALERARFIMRRNGP